MYKSISDYGIIGNCRSCALVSDEGSIDWMCLPDFDSDAQFLNILDDEKGGFFKVTPIGFYKSHQKYKENTNILKTYFFSQKGSISLTDFMPLSLEEDESGDVAEYGTKIVRLVKALKGSHEFELKLKLTPEYALGEVKIEVSDGKVVIQSQKHKYVLYKKHHRVTISSKKVISVKFRLNEGEQEFFSLDFWPLKTTPKNYTKGEINAHLARLYKKTTLFWQKWVKKCNYTGEYKPQIVRSALALKLLTYTPTGAILAAATTSLPEKIGGSLNWDYRYTWLRDASFTVYAFLGLGYVKEAERFIGWLEEVCAKENDQILKIMYGIRGDEELHEKDLGYLKGYMKSKPVRIGNGASNQKQFDIFGEVLSAISLYVNYGGTISEPVKGFVKKLGDFCCAHWKEKDAGIWEARHGEKHNTYSKLMCWVGLDRGIRIANQLKLKNVDVKRWEATKQEIKEDILKKGYNQKLQSFVAYYGSDVLDTSTLNIPVVGFLAADDPKVLSTLDQVMQKLVVDWFVLRTSDTANKLQEGEGTFFLSTFWLVDCLSLLGRVDEAKVWLDRIIHYATPLGLYAEEFDPLTKSHLGNFPQAFTHLGLINSILNLNQAEMFGSEKRATIQTERLNKVIKSLFGEEVTKNLNKEISLKKILKKLFRRSDFN